MNEIVLRAIAAKLHRIREDAELVYGDYIYARNREGGRAYRQLAEDARRAINAVNMKLFALKGGR
jgi:hypothetical protein